MVAEGNQHRVLELGVLSAVNVLIVTDERE